MQKGKCQWYTCYSKNQNITKLEKYTWVPQILHTFYLFLLTTSDDFNSFLWVFIKVTGFNYIWINNITLKLDSHLPKLFYLLQQKPLKNDEKFVLFNLKSSFRSQDIQIFVLNVWSCRKGNLIKKIRLVSKFVTWQPG